MMFELENLTSEQDACGEEEENTFSAGRDSSSALSRHLKQLGPLASPYLSIQFVKARHGAKLAHFQAISWLVFANGARDLQWDGTTRTTAGRMFKDPNALNHIAVVP